jgi:hypothetical protein
MRVKCLFAFRIGGGSSFDLLADSGEKQMELHSDGKDVNLQVFERRSLFAVDLGRLSKSFVLF